MMESFFGILKSEMFYGYERTFKSLSQLEQAIIDYIDYYNNKRIKVKIITTRLTGGLIKGYKPIIPASA